MKVSVSRIGDVIDGTWPAAQLSQSGPWTLRTGNGGGSRVSAATAEGPVDASDISQAEQAMRDLGQQPLFMIRGGQSDLDQVLDQRGYQIKDPVTVYACPVSLLTDIPLPRVCVFSIWEPLVIMREIWTSGGIGPARQAIMDRVAGPKTGLLARHNEQPAGAAFAAIHDGIAMVHAVEILPHQRRDGVGKWVMRGAAFWAEENQAHTLSVMCTQDNAGANALYTSLGMQVVGQYHYRHLPTETDGND